MGDGTNRRGKNPSEEIYEMVEIINRGGTVIDEGRSLHVTSVKLRRLVNMYHIIRQLLQRGEVIRTNEAVRIEILPHPRVPPVNRDCVHMEGIDQFFCGPAGAVAIFKGDVKAVVTDPIELSLVTVFLGNAKPGVIQSRPGGIHLSPTVEDVEKVLSFLGGTVGISAKEGTEMRLCSSDLFRVCDRGSDHRLELLIKGVNRQIVGARIIYLVRDDSVVTFLPIRSVEFLAPVDFYSILQAVLMSNVSVDDKFGWVVPDNIKMGF